MAVRVGPPILAAAAFRLDSLDSRPHLARLRINGLQCIFDGAVSTRVFAHSGSHGT